MAAMKPRTSVRLHYVAPRGRLCRNPASQVTRTLPCGAEGGPRPGIEPCGRGLQRSKQGAKYGLRPCNCGYSLFRDVVAGKCKEANKLAQTTEYRKSNNVDIRRRN